MKLSLLLRLLPLAAGLPLAALAAAPEVRDTVAAKVDAEYPSLEVIYQDLHTHPELSFVEKRTAGILAQQLREAGCEVTEGVGNTGIVAVLKNGAGPTLLVRADMDALPIKELTGLPYASQVTMPDLTGKTQPAMHACGHDTHVTTLIGTARMMATLKDRWSGTLVLIGQPAEEIGGGARSMLQEGLFTKFPRPDNVIAFHVGGDAPAGMIATLEGPSYANVDSIDIVVRGIGGHGARPHSTRDPIVLASEIVLALQTIVSRELKPGTPAVVTIGAIHGGTKRNIIPAEVRLELTLRSYSDEVAQHLLTSIKRIAENTARAAGVPDDLLPIITVEQTRTPFTYNDPTLTRRLAGVFAQWFPAEQLTTGEAGTYGEDFAEYGRTSPRVPISIFWVGGSDPKVLADAAAKGQLAPSNHSAFWAPLPEPTIKTAITAMTAAALDLLGKK